MEEFQPETPGAARTVQDSNLVELGGQSQEAFFVARRPTLPWDILLIIMRFVASKRVISRLMRTCHTLYTHGLPLVAEACMLLPHQNMSSVILFCKFMLRPPAPGHYPRLVTCPLGLHKPVIIPGPFQLPRPLLLRELILPGSGLENLRQTCRGVKEDLDVLAYVLSQAQNLETLGLGCMEDLLTKNTRFCTVIMMMKKLDMVLFREVKRMAMAVLNSIQSPVTKAIIAFPKIRPRVAFNPALERAYPAMTAFRDTLERLQLLELPIRYTMPDKPFLRVHSLTLRMHSAANIGLHNIALAFPHLRNLSWSYASEMIDWEELEERRELSLARTYQGWPSLKKLRCNDSVAYALAFRCPVQYWVGRYLDHPVQLPVFHCALRDLRPKHLYFSLHIPAFISDLKWVFPESENRITHLNLDWCTQEDEGLNWLQDCEDPATLLADMFVSDRPSQPGTFLTKNNDHPYRTNWCLQREP
ncbi:hypothetical protein BXZ70DRAFT_563761 [Cristinia sonorae]|uniref:Uncharacterized protein n=1 Tax=Cristinia sonorae TaxID=1940300 RepID=A0A8K0UFA0_9AGAR|nr:hypothetical protein BXZ70DRAFT_563761 [Cristinia sonorae]